MRRIDILQPHTLQYDSTKLRRLAAIYEPVDYELSMLLDTLAQMLDEGVYMDG